MSVAVSGAITGAVLLGSLMLASPASAQQIVVQGNRRIEADTIRSYFQPRPGERLDAAKIDDGIKGLFATGLFQDVNVNQNGGRLVVTVVENSVVNRVAFEGNKKVKKETLEAEVQSRARGPFSRAVVQADVQRIIDVYRRQGRYDVTVEPKIIDQPNGRVDLVFEIKEGDKTKIQRIGFIGNNAYSDSRLLDIITTTESNWLSWIKTSDVYDADRIESDRELLRRFYLKNGYADFRVVSAVADFDREKNAFFITFTVDEGQRYSFGEVDLQSNIRDIDPAGLRGKIQTVSGRTYNADQVDKSVEAVTIELAKRGYAFAQVRPRGTRDFEGKLIGITYVVEEGPRVYVERINVRGNTRTREYVVRREFDLAEGDAYNRVLVDRAERRLKNLAYFKSVKITNEPGSAPDRIILNVDVEDQPTGEFSIAGGYSTSDGFMGEVSLGERNFLGRGQIVRGTVQWGQRARGYEISFTEPYFMGYRVTGGFDIFGKETDDSKYASYSNRITGGTLRLGFPLSEALTLGVNYTGYNQELTIPAAYTNNIAGDGEASYAIKQAIGSSFISMIGYRLVYNTLDNTKDPSSGLLIDFKNDIAGVGGDVNFIKTTLDARWYSDLGSNFIGLLRGQVGNITGFGSKDLRILDTFFMGPSLVRGFAPSGIGPRDLLTTNSDAMGATTYWGVSAEVQFPILGMARELGLKGAVFADAGSAYDASKSATLLNQQGRIRLNDDSSVRSSIGAGLIWASPFGPIRIDYAHALSQGTYDRTQSFRFSGGTRF